jgi:outer membrane biogenesis lipoprotein LolB
MDDDTATAAVRRILHVAFCLALAGCAPRRLILPTDPGSPLPNAAAVHATISSTCTNVRSLTAELRLTGRAGDRRVRGRLVAGFERPASMRLEGVAPFGSPAFILAARGREAVLLLPRDGRVVSGEPPEAILGALTGVSLAPADLQALLTGCVVPVPRAVGGRLHGNGWASIQLDGGATIYLRREGRTWQLRAARRAGWQVEYDQWQNAFPETVRLRSIDQPAAVDLTATVTQLETNQDIDAAAFTVDVPSAARPLTLEELRETGPLKGS